jgi:hypothetical protein
MTVEMLKAHRGAPETLTGQLGPGDIEWLVPLLAEKDDTVRYPAFLVLCARSRNHPDIYPFWDVFTEKLDDQNSFQRNIGATLLGLNVRWDSDRRFRDIFHRFMRLCTDEKPITARLTIQTISDWAEYVPELLEETVSILTAIDLGSFRETMRKLILTDIMNALLAVREVRPSAVADDYMLKVLTGSILDKKGIRQFEVRIKR